jgi:AcrR family transcriptional regulator
MQRERLTRAQRREQTRECLLGAAREQFVKKGLAATSVEDIAEAAGYTRGAFYSNFGDKQELLIELLRRDEDMARASLQATLAEGGTPDEMKERAIVYYSQCVLEQDCFSLWIEAKLLACRDPQFQERISAFRQEKLDLAREHILAFSERNGRKLALRVDELALGLLSLCDGLQFSRMCNPQMVTDKVMHTVFAGFFSCVLWRRPEEASYEDHRARVVE